VQKYSFYRVIFLYLELSKHVISCCRNLGEREMLDCQIYFTIQLRQQSQIHRVIEHAFARSRQFSVIGIIFSLKNRLILSDTL